MIKKLARNSAAKLAAFLVILFCIGTAGYVVSDSVFYIFEKLSREDDSWLYGFESNFESSRWLLWRISDTWGELCEQLVKGNVNWKADEDFFPGEYYARRGEVVLTNSTINILSQREFINSSLAYIWVKPEEERMHPGLINWGDSWEELFDRNPEPNTIVMVRITEEQVKNQREQWNWERQFVIERVQRVTILAAVALVALLYLLIVTGRRPEDEEVHTIPIDCMYVECNVILMLAAGMLGGGCFAALLVEALDWMGYDSYNPFEIFQLPSIILLMATSALMTELLLSLVRNIKNHTFIKRSFLLRACRWCWKVTQKLVVWCWRVTKTLVIWCWNMVRQLWGWLVQRKNPLRSSWLGIKKAKNAVVDNMGRSYRTRTVLMILFVFSLVLSVLAFFAGALISDVGILFIMLGGLWFLLSAWGLAKCIGDFEVVVNGLKRIRNGEIDFKLTDIRSGLFKSVADDINFIGDGMQNAVQKAIRAERMKSELITNVSHDLKTPLTSILSYSDLLCQEELTPEEANDYAKIIYEKGLKLKNLTSDLFDFSKVQSGAEVIESERLDLCTLVQQALAEQNNAIEASGLVMKVTLPDHGVTIWADGKKMSRVMENLISNCTKYALRGTRVFLTVTEQENNTVTFEMKNIANYEMEFAPDEITERFVRGDMSRSTDGSGLGLAIAKSYTSVCGGLLKVETDGDLFKVRITFPLYGN